MEFYSEKIEDVFRGLNSSIIGLSSSEAEKRLEKYGKNELRKLEKISPFKIFLAQFKSPIVWILIAATIISLLIKEYTDSLVIFIIILLNSVLGFIQEFKAEKAIEALKKLVSLKVKVIRDGQEQEIDSSLLVPGDIIVIETGDKIPADSRLIEIHNLQIQEAALTGESLPIKKEARVIKEEAGVADRKNMVYSTTIVTKGRGKAVVTATGMSTEIGKIAEMIQKPEVVTPLQKKLAHLAKWLGILVIVVAVIVFTAGVLKKNSVVEMFMAAIALAVAAIPEGLPAVVTIALAIGVQRMIGRHALVRKLPSVETLGSCSVICSDKTGTLTYNEMTVKKIFVNEEIVDVGGSGYFPEGNFSSNPKKFDILLKIGALNCDARLEKEGEEYKVIGDPTEGSLIVSALKAGLDKKELEKRFSRTDEIPFSSERKRMTTIHKTEKGRVAYMKGAPDVVIELCDRIWYEGKVERLTRQMKKKILEKNKEFAQSALRVLGFAYKELRDEKTEKEIENDMVFVGLQGMIDPPRKEVKEAIAKCKKAGIKVIMITGDFRETAKAIADELGIVGKSVTGHELEEMSGKDLEKEVDNIAIYARVDPKHKMMIINALRKRGYIIAMTGDGVNDAPAIKEADLGIAMGITGTDVAKEASDMILTDDNFASIVNAVEEGRNIFDNIRKFVYYLLSSNTGEVLTIFIALTIGLPLPLLAIQILWINLMTDGLPALALGLDPPEKGIMARPPRKAGEKIISRRRVILMSCVGFIMMVGTLTVFYTYSPWSSPGNLRYAQTAAFAVLMMFQMYNVFNSRSEEESAFVGFFSNKYLIGSVIISVLLQFMVIYVSPLNIWFKTIPLAAIEWLYIFLIASTVLIFGELIKLLVRKKVLSR